MSDHKYLYLLLFFSFNFFHLFFLVGGYLLYNIVVGFVIYLFIWLHRVFAGGRQDRHCAMWLFCCSPQTLSLWHVGSLVAAHGLSCGILVP